MTSKAADLLVYATGKNDSSVDTFPRSQIDDIILGCSQNSEYFRRQKEKDEKHNVRIRGMKKSNPMSRPVPPARRANVDSTVLSNVLSRRSVSTSVVVDMDMFYFACELIKGPQPRTVLHNGKLAVLKEIPAVVGRGM